MDAASARLPSKGKMRAEASKHGLERSGKEWMSRPAFQSTLWHWEFFLSLNKDAHLRAIARRFMFTRWFQIKYLKGNKTFLQRHNHWLSDCVRKPCFPDNQSLLLYAFARSPADVTNADSWYNYVTERLQSTWQVSEKIAGIPVPSGRNPSRLQCARVTPSSMALPSFCDRP